MTGPHMFDGISHPPQMMQDSVPKPKAAPLDTTRLKKDLGTWGDQAATYAGDFFSGNGKMLKDMKQDVARGDSLQNARDGKISAKKSGKP